MKLTTKAEGLSKKLAQHAKVIQQKSSTFTSDAVLLSADGTTLQLTSTDLTTYLVNAEPAEVTEAGRALVPFKFLKDIVSALSLIHISEPTRLGMISYAVFCLKKKKKKKKKHTIK